MTPVAAVLGIGARTALGEDAPSTLAAARAGVPGFAEHPYLVARSGDPYVVARAPYLPPELDGEERWLELAVPAAREALASLAALSLRVDSLSVFVGLPPARPGVRELQAARFSSALASRLRDLGPAAVETVPSGHASGILALERGLALLKSGKAELCLVGGADSWIDPDALDWIEATSRLHAGENAYGFIPGEGAGFCLIAAPSLARKHARASWADILAVGSAREPHVLGGDGVCLGQGLTDAFRKVLSAADGKVEQVVGDANGEPYRADEYGFAVSRLSERFVSASDFVAPADCWGDVGAASGPLGMALACTAGRKGYAPGPRTLVWTSSDGGDRGAVLLRAAPPGQED